MNAIDRFDLERYILKFGARPIKRRDEWVMVCPTCGKEKLNINVRKRTWHCWVCQEYTRNMEGKRVPVKGAGGLLSLIQFLENCTRVHAVSMVLNEVGYYAVNLAALEDEDFRCDPRNTTLRPAPEILPPENWKMIHGILPYLWNRGITEEDVRAFGLFYCDAGRYANRVIFPVWERSKMVYWQARAMWEGNGDRGFRKSLNPPVMQGMASPSEVLMNLDTARHYPRVAVVEGPVDCIHTGPSAVCTFGKKISPIQALKLKYAGVTAIDLMWDGPSEREPQGAWPEMLRASSLLAGMFDVRLVFLPRGDPGDYRRSELDAFRAQSYPAASASRLAVL